MRFRPGWLQAGVCLLALLALSACEAPKPKVKIPARLLYLEGQSLLDQELYGEAVTKFQEVADQNPGTLLGSYAYLQIAEIRVRQENWDKAETNYRLFLTANQTSHLTPYVLYRLAYVNHQASFTGALFPTREVDRDQQANQRIIQEYRRFFFLYPKSVFMDEVRGYALDARTTLAEHERRVADFYFNREHYNAAASRYLYLLRNYPQYPDTAGVLDRLIRSYRRNQQPELADEMARLARQAAAPASAAAHPGPAPAPPGANGASPRASTARR